MVAVIWTYKDTKPLPFVLLYDTLLILLAHSAVTKSKTQLDSGLRLYRKDVYLKFLKVYFNIIES